MNAAPPYVIIQTTGKNCTALCMWRWQTAGLGKASQEDRVLQGDFQSLWQGARQNFWYDKKEINWENPFFLCCAGQGRHNPMSGGGDCYASARAFPKREEIYFWEKKDKEICTTLAQPFPLEIDFFFNIFLRKERKGNMYNLRPAFSFGHWFLFGKLPD